MPPAGEQGGGVRCPFQAAAEMPPARQNGSGYSSRDRISMPAAATPRAAGAGRRHSLIRPGPASRSVRASDVPAASAEPSRTPPRAVNGHLAVIDADRGSRPARTRATSFRPWPLCRCTTSGAERSISCRRARSASVSADPDAACSRRSPYSRMYFCDDSSQAACSLPSRIRIAMGHVANFRILHAVSPAPHACHYPFQLR